MIMTLILIILFFAICAIWFDKRTIAIYLYTASFIIAIASFIHHMTDTIGLSL